MKAATYVRMSTLQQEHSPAQQLAAIKRHCQERGIEIVAQFSDHGISGDLPKKRPGFLRMLEAGRWIAPLRDAGVTLETVADGPEDWDDFGRPDRGRSRGRIKAPVSRRSEPISDPRVGGESGRGPRLHRADTLRLSPLGGDRRAVARIVTGAPRRASRRGGEAIPRVCEAGMLAELAGRSAECRGRADCSWRPLAKEYRQLDPAERGLRWRSRLGTDAIRPLLHPGRRNCCPTPPGRRRQDNRSRPATPRGCRACDRGSQDVRPGAEAPRGAIPGSPRAQFDQAPVRTGAVRLRWHDAQ
jgi:hypothetical protein